MSVTSARGQALMDLLPPLYTDSKVMQDMMQAVGVEFDALRGALDEILQQWFARAVTWSVGEWEQQLGLPVDPGLTDRERQDRVVSRLRGYGTCTVALVKQVAESYKYGSIEVVEDHSAYRLIVIFVDRTGVPSNQADLEAAVRAVVPAHLDIVYQFNWLTFAELRTEGFTFAAMGAKGLTFAAWRTYK